MTYYLVEGMVPQAIICQANAEIRLFGQIQMSIYSFTLKYCSMGKWFSVIFRFAEFNVLLRTIDFLRFFSGE